MEPFNQKLEWKTVIIQELARFSNGVPDLPEHSVGHYFHQDPFEA